MLKSLFASHPASVGESYGEHMVMAGWFGLRMILCGVACLFHGLLPFLFVTTARRTIDGLHDQMVLNRKRTQKHTDNQRAIV